MRSRSDITPPANVFMRQDPYARTMKACHLTRQFELCLSVGKRAAMPALLPVLRSSWGPSCRALRVFANTWEEQQDFPPQFLPLMEASQIADNKRLYWYRAQARLSLRNAGLLHTLSEFASHMCVESHARLHRWLLFGRRRHLTMSNFSGLPVSMPRRSACPPAICIDIMRIHGSQAAVYMLRPRSGTLEAIRRRQAEIFGEQVIEPGTISVRNCIIYTAASLSGPPPSSSWLLCCSL